MNLKLTKNFYSWMRTVLMSRGTSATSGLSGNVNTIGTLQDTDGTIYSKIYFDGSYYKNYVTLNYGTTSNSGGTHIRFGSSTAKPEEGDYSLTGNYILGTDYTTELMLPDIPSVSDENVVSPITWSVKFKAGDNPITIGEIGLFKSLATTSSASSSKSFLIGRVAFEKEIEIGAGQSATFQISIEI